MNHEIKKFYFTKKMKQNTEKTAEQRDLVGTKTLEGFAAADNYNRWLLSRILPHLRGEDLLEIGCGLGNISALMKDRFTMTAVDIRRDYTDLVGREHGIRTLCVDLSAEAAFDNEFDSAICLNVLEHIEEEKNALENIRRALRPGGRFAVLVPAFNWLYGSVDKAIFHQRRYTRRRLKKALKNAGFRVEKTFYFNVFGIPGWFWQNRIRKKKQNSPRDSWSSSTNSSPPSNTWIYPSAR